MNQTVDYAALLVKARHDVPHELWIAPFIQREDGVSNVVCCLEQAIFTSRGEVRHVSKIVEHTPLCAEVAKSVNPQLRALLVVTVSENEKASLRVLLFLITPRQESVETLYDLLRRKLHGVLTVNLCVLFNHGSEEHHAVLVRVLDQEPKLVENGLTLCRWTHSCPN